MTLLLNSFAHFLVDGVCCSILFAAAAGGQDIAVAVLLYNTLAFSTQCVVGLIMDRTGKAKSIARIAMAVVATGGLLPLPLIPKVITVAIGNSLFHVGGGMMTMMNERERSAPLGIFVAPGAFGVTLGTLFPGLRLPFAIALLLIGAFMGRIVHNDFDYDAAPSAAEDEKGSIPVVCIVLLTAAVAVRAIGGSAVSFPWKSGALMSLLLTAFVFAGKFLGGFVLDKIGTVKAAVISIVPASLLIAFCANWAFPSMAGQFLLNLTMPVTLWLLYKAIPDSPGLAFGLAASALWPGTIIGGLLTLTGPTLWFCVIISFLFGLAAILICERRLSE